MKTKITLIFVLFFIIIFSFSCNFEEELNIIEENKDNLTLLRENSLFKSYEKNINYFIDLNNEIMVSITKEDLINFLEIYEMYNLNPESYEIIALAETENLLGDKLKAYQEIITTLQQQVTEIREMELFINLTKEEQQKLSENLFKNMFPFDEILEDTPVTRNNPYLRCTQFCDAERTIDEKAAWNSYYCASGVNVASCALTGGSTFVLNLIAQFGIIANLQIILNQILCKHKLCLQKCLDEAYPGNPPYYGC